MQKIKSALKFINYTVERVEFTRNNNFCKDSSDIDLDISSNIEIIDNEKFNLFLNVEVFPQNKDNNYPFNMVIDVIGYFEVNCDDKQQRSALMEQNSIAILFPYIRALISTYTSASNITPLILPPINVKKYIEQKNKQEG